MRTVSKKVLSLLLVTVLVLSAIPFAAFADCEHTARTEVQAKAATCLVAGNTAYWQCNGCDKKFTTQDGNEEATDTVIPAHVTALTPVSQENATCTNEGHKAYYKCADCGKEYQDANATVEATAAWKTLPALGHIDSNKNGKCDRGCGEDTSYSVEFVIKDPAGNTKGSKTVTKYAGERFGAAPSASSLYSKPDGYVYEETNGVIWKNDDSALYDANAFVTGGITYTAKLKERPMSLTVAFRLDGVEKVFCTVENLRYEAIKGVSVYDYIRTHTVSGGECAATDRDSIANSFAAAYDSKSIEDANSRTSVDVTGYEWKNSKQFLSANTGNSINSGALKMDTCMGDSSPNPDLKIYADLKSTTTFKITFASTAPFGASVAAVKGVPTSPKSVAYNGIISDLPNPTCTGYVFAGWYTAAETGKTTYANGAFIPASTTATQIKNGEQYKLRSDVTLYPYWVEEVDAWVYVHQDKVVTASSTAKIQGVLPGTDIAKRTVMNHVQGASGSNVAGPFVNDEWTTFITTPASAKTMNAYQSTNSVTQPLIFHVYAPGATAKTIAPGDSGANGTNPSGGSGSGSGSSAAADPSNPKTGDAQRTELNVAAITLAVATVALTVMTSVMFIRRKSEI